MIRKHQGERKIEFLKEIGVSEPDSSQMKRELDRILQHLPERSRRILQLRYGIETGISWKLKEIGQEFGVSGQRVREIISKSIRILRDRCNPDSFLSLGFSAKTIASLRNADIRTIEDLVRKTESELLIMKGIGRESLDKIKNVLSDKRLSVGSKNESLEMIEVDPQWDVMFLRISSPSHQCLRSLGIKTIADLIGKSETDFFSHRSGRGCLREIKFLFGIEKLPFSGRLNVKKELFPPPHYVPLCIEEVASYLGIPLSNLLEDLQNGKFKGLPFWRVGKGWKGLRCDREDLDDWIMSRTDRSHS